jgi:PLP dependent protein
MAALLAATRRLLKMSSSTGTTAAVTSTTATTPVVAAPTAAARTLATTAPTAVAAAGDAPAAPSPTSAVAANLRDVRDRALRAAQRASRDPARVRIVAVSKTKPAELLKEAYDFGGQRDFGENYVQELLDKSPRLPADVRWRFIGHLQSNKAKALVEGVPGLMAVETVDTVKLADKLESAVKAARSVTKAASDKSAPCSSSSSPARLDVFVQVNTSGEASKHGVDPGPACVDLARHIHQRCPHLRLAGLMTIGMPDYSSRPENFECLNRCRDEVAREVLGLGPGAKAEEVASALELSMGMSGDFEQAVEMGSTNVRVGSTIFGARDYGGGAVGAGAGAAK